MENNNQNPYDANPVQPYYQGNVYNNNGFQPPASGGRHGFAIAALVLSIVSFCCCGIALPFSILAIIFAIVALVNHYDGKVKSIVAICLASISGLFCIAFWTSPFDDLIFDVVRFYSDTQAVEEYETTGNLPDYLEKYDDPEYDNFWRIMRYDGIYDYMDATRDILEQSGAQYFEKIPCYIE